MEGVTEGSLVDRRGQSLQDGGPDDDGEAGAAGRVPNCFIQRILNQTDARFVQINNWLHQT